MLQVQSASLLKSYIFGKLSKQRVFSMKFLNSIITVACLSAALFIANPVFSQKDTLHLYYHYSHLKMHDSTSAKIDAWIKSLNGKRVDMDVVAYYDKAETKPYATQRADELFISLNRKARALFNIKFIGAKKGAKSQRTVVDIIYSISDQPAQENNAASKGDNETKAKPEKGMPAKGAPAQAATGSVSALGYVEGPKDSYGWPDAQPAGTGLVVSPGDVKRIKKSKVIIAQSADRKASEDLITAVRNYWNFTSDVTTMPYKKAKEYAKSNGKAVIIVLVGIRQLPHQHDESKDAYKQISKGGAIMIETASGDILASAYIPTYGEMGDVAPEGLAFGVSYLNQLFKVVEEKDLPSDNERIKEYYTSRVSDLKDKTLLIPEIWLASGFNQAAIDKSYNSKAKVVSFEEFSKAILSKQENVAYDMVAPFPLKGEYVYFHFLVDAKTGHVYAACKPKEGDTTTESDGQGSNGYINAKHIDWYNGALSGY